MLEVNYRDALACGGYCVCVSVCILASFPGFTRFLMWSFFLFDLWTTTERGREKAWKILACDACHNVIIMRKLQCCETSYDTRIWLRPVSLGDAIRSLTHVPSRLDILYRARGVVIAECTCFSKVTLHDQTLPKYLKNACLLLGHQKGWNYIHIRVVVVLYQAP